MNARRGPASLARAAVLACWMALATCLLAACASGSVTIEERPILVTAYCGSGADNGYDRGHWWLLYLDFWNKYINYGSHAGEPYDGLTASGTRLHAPHPGLFSGDTFLHPWMLPPRLIFPWLWFESAGTLAADTRYYPFGTQIYVPGWGWGVVEDRGSAIKGPDRLDAYFFWYWQPDRWGRQKVTCTIMRDGPAPTNVQR